MTYLTPYCQVQTTQTGCCQQDTVVPEQPQPVINVYKDERTFPVTNNYSTTNNSTTNNTTNKYYTTKNYNFTSNTNITTNFFNVAGEKTSTTTVGKKVNNVFDNYRKDCGCNTNERGVRRTDFERPIAKKQPKVQRQKQVSYNKGCDSIFSPGGFFGADLNSYGVGYHNNSIGNALLNFGQKNRYDY